LVGSVCGDWFVPGLDAEAGLNEVAMLRMLARKLQKGIFKLKKFLVCVAILIASPSYAAELTEIEKGYIWFNVATGYASTFCGAHEIPGAIYKMGDRNGIDVKAYSRAIIAAAAVSIDLPYNRDDLIPAVTQTYRLAQRTIGDDMELKKAKTCENWIAILRQAGTIE
jgi:hypothetical protein